MTTLKYAVGAESDRFNYEYDCKDLEWAKENPEDEAAEIAEQYYNDHDGQEDNWPLVFKIDFGGDVVECAVSLEYDPTFTAMEI